MDIATMSATIWGIRHAQHAHFSHQGHAGSRGHRRHFKRWMMLPFPWTPLTFIALGVGVLVLIPLVIALVATVVALAIALVVSAGMAVGLFGATGLVTWHLARAVAPSLRRGKGKRKGKHARAGLSAADVPVVDVLRLRYAAGEIGQTEFRTRLTELLKERYVRGELTLPEFESRVRHLYLDPALRPPV